MSVKIFHEPEKSTQLKRAIRKDGNCTRGELIASKCQDAVIQQFIRLMLRKEHCTALLFYFHTDANKA